MAVRAIFFDYGDTLWRYPGTDGRLLLEAYRRALSRLPRDSGLPSPEAAVEAVGASLERAREGFTSGPDHHLQAPTRDYVAAGLSSLGLTLAPEVLHTFTEVLFEAEVEQARQPPPEPDMRSALLALTERGYRLACVSNNFMSAAAIERALAVRQLADLLDFTVSSAEAGYRKPHAGCFLPALRRLTLGPREVVFVGDRLDTDIEGAVALGMRAVLTRQYRQEEPGPDTARPDHVIEHLSELVPYLDQLASL